MQATGVNVVLIGFILVLILAVIASLVIVGISFFGKKE